MTLAHPRCYRCSEPLAGEYVPAVDLDGRLVCDLCAATEGVKRWVCKDCGAPARWPFEHCQGCLEARFGSGDEAA